MIFKFYVSCLKNKILHLNEVYYYKRYRRKNRIKLSWVKMFMRQHEKAFMHPLNVKPIRINKASFSKKTTKNKKIRR